MRAILIATLASLLALPAPAPGTRAAAQDSAAQGDHAAVLARFRERVDTYCRLRDRLSAPFSAVGERSDSLSRLLARRYLASAIRTARASVRAGDIFDPNTSLAFRELIADAPNTRDVEAFLLALSQDHPVTHSVQIYVNEPFPWNAAHEAPATLLERFPALPAGIQYQVVGRSLVLWDSQAELVVDVLPGVFGPPGGEGER